MQNSPQGGWQSAHGRHARPVGQRTPAPRSPRAPPCSAAGWPARRRRPRSPRSRLAVARQSTISFSGARCGRGCATWICCRNDASGGRARTGGALCGPVASGCGPCWSGAATGPSTSASWTTGAGRCGGAKSYGHDDRGCGATPHSSRGASPPSCPRSC